MLSGQQGPRQAGSLARSEHQILQTNSAVSISYLPPLPFMLAGQQGPRQAGALAGREHQGFCAVDGRHLH